MFKNVLVPLDGSDLAEEAVGMAAAIARASHATIDLLMVHEPLFPGRDDITWNERQIVVEERYLHGIAAELESGAGVSSRQTVVRGQPSELIATRAADSGADLIVMTSHGRTGWSRAWLGSVADAVVRGVSIPVLMLRPLAHRHDRRATRKPIDRIVVPLDGSAVSMEILGAVRELARCWNARLDFIRVVEPVPALTAEAASPLIYFPNIVDVEATAAVEREAIRDLERDVRAFRESGIAVGDPLVTVSPKPAQAIVDFAKAREAGLIAMASHGRGHSRLLIGSVADKVRRATDLPVLLQRARFSRRTHSRMTFEEVAEQLPALSAIGGHT
jgi:nucleotide-binding universal stress UspA family protein